MKQLIKNYINAVDAYEKSATYMRKEAVKVAREKLLAALEGWQG